MFEPSVLPDGMHWVIKGRPGRPARDLGPFTYDWRFAPGSPENTRGVRQSHKVTDIGNALREVYDSETFLSGYIMRDANGSPLIDHPRLSEESIPLIRAHGFDVTMRVLLVDVDLIGPDGNKVTWTPEAMALYEHQIAQIGPMGTYLTLHGWRAAALLNRDITYEEFPDVMASHLAKFDALGIVYDKAAKSFFQYMRAPHVIRNGKPYRSVLSLNRMDEIDPPSGVKGAARVRTEVGGKGDPTRSVFGDALRSMEHLGAIRGNKVDIVCPNASQHSSGSDFDSSTVLYAPSEGKNLGWIKCSHGHCQGFKAWDWIRLFPAGVIPARHQSAAVADANAAAPSVELVSLKVAGAAMYELIKSAPTGLTMASATCGTGKTYWTGKVALERQAVQDKATADHDAEYLAKDARAAARALKLGVTHVPEERTNHRDALNSLTTIIVPTNEMAKQFTSDLRAAGGKVQRRLGILSEKQTLPDGSVVYECIHGDVAEELVKGGMSIPTSFCPTCEIKAECAIRSGRDGEDDAPITVAAHLPFALPAAPTELVVLDDSINSSTMFKTTAIKLGDLKDAVGMLREMDDRYRAALAPALYSVIAWISSLPSDEMTDVDPEDPSARIVKLHELKSALDMAIPVADASRAFLAVGSRDPLSCARLAFDDMHVGAKSTHYSPVTIAMLQGGRVSKAHVKKLSSAGRVLHAIYEAAMAESPEAGGSVVRLAVSNVVVVFKWGDGEERTRTVREVTIKHVDPTFAAVIRRQGRTVILDAGIDAQLGALSKVTFPFDYSDRVTRLHVVDGAMVERTFAKTELLSRSVLLPNRKVNHDLLASALRVVGEWAGESPISERVALVTYQAVELVIAEALAGRGPQVVIDALRWATADVDGVAPMPGLVRLALGHYNALRGLDKWKDGYDIANIGDPRPHLDTVRMERSVFSEGETLTARVLSLASDELDQVHGRMRTPRLAPLLVGHRKALALGGILPGEWKLHAVVERTVQLGAGRFAPTSAMDQDELRALIVAFGGTQAEFAAAARVPGESLKSYLATGAKRRQVPSRAAVSFRAVAPIEKVEPVANPERDRFAQLVERVGGKAKAARRIGCSVKTIGRYLAGHRIPPDAFAALEVRGYVVDLPDVAPANDSEREAG